MSFRKLINIETFSCNLEFVISDKINIDISNVYKKYNVRSLEESTIEGILICGELSKYYLLIDLQYLSHNTIAHEIYHAVVRITEDRDIVDEETQAWLCGFLSDKVYSFLKKKKLEIK